MSISIELTAIISMGILSVFWFAGLSFLAKRNERDIERLWNEHKGLGDEIRNSMRDFQTDVGKALHSLSSSLSRIEGRLYKNDDKEL